jgi:hypothetical protein
LYPWANAIASPQIIIASSILFRADDVWFKLTAWRASSMSSEAIARFAVILLYVS